MKHTHLLNSYQSNKDMASMKLCSFKLHNYQPHNCR